MHKWIFVWLSNRRWRCKLALCIGVITSRFRASSLARFPPYVSYCSTAFARPVARHEKLMRCVWLCTSGQSAAAYSISISSTFTSIIPARPPVCIQRHLQLGQGGNGLAWLAFSSRRHRSKASQVEGVQRRIGMKLVMLEFHAIAFLKCWCSPSSAVLGLCSALLFQLSTSY